MKLYFLRHGAADDPSRAKSDFDRRLTTEGIDEMRLVARGLANLVPEVDFIFSSPLLRALETAQIAETSVKVTSGSINVTEKLAAGAFDVTALAHLVERLPQSARVILVGHEPDFSMTVRRLTGAVIEMKKAGLAFVEVHGCESGSGVLRWLLTPRLLQLCSTGGP